MRRVFHLGPLAGPGARPWLRLVRAISSIHKRLKAQRMARRMALDNPIRITCSNVSAPQRRNGICGEAHHAAEPFQAHSMP
jgi:hypothetical protein